MKGKFKKVSKTFKSKVKEQKYPLDEEVTINNLQWRIAEYKFKYGKQWVYILQHETVEGTYKTLEFNEKTLTSIIESGSEEVLK